MSGGYIWYCICSPSCDSALQLLNQSTSCVSKDSSYRLHKTLFGARVLPFFNNVDEPQANALVLFDEGTACTTSAHALKGEIVPRHTVVCDLFLVCLQASQERLGRLWGHLEALLLTLQGRRHDAKAAMRCSAADPVSRFHCNCNSASVYQVQHHEV